MNEKELTKQFTKDKYQVYLLTSKIPVPFQFATHPWFVIVKDGKPSRWEIVGHIYKNRKDREGHLYNNFHKDMTKGFEKYFFTRIFNHGNILSKLQGNKYSLAERVVNFIENE